MAPALLLRLRALVASCCFRPAPALEDHGIIPEIISAPASEEDDVIPEIGSSVAPALALEDDDLLREILIRLPQLPSSLLRASLVCKRWYRVISDPFFLRRFRAHHRTPPLLGFFGLHKPDFTPLLRPPNCIPSERFSLAQPRRGLFVHGCRHGLVILLNQHQFEAVVWDPVAGRRHTVPYPPEFRGGGLNVSNQGAVLRTAVADDGGGGGCFKFVFTRTKLSSDGNTKSVSMAVYESATGKWSETSSSTVIPSSCSFQPNVLVRNTLYGFFHWPTGILEFDTDTNSVGVIQKPKSIHSYSSSFFHVMRTQDGGLGLAKLSATIIQLWGRRIHGCATADAEWVLQKTVDLDKLVFRLLPTSVRELHLPRMVGYDEDNHVIHVAMNDSVFTVNLGTLQYTKVFDGPRIFSYYPYTSFYTLLGARRQRPLHAKKKK